MAADIGIVAGRNYPAYSFANHSEDILQLFVWACGLIGVRPRRTNRVTISIVRRADVTTLDRIIGGSRSQSVPAPVLSFDLCCPSR